VGDDRGFVGWDGGRGAAVRYDPPSRRYDTPPVSLALSGRFVIAGGEGPILCRAAFEHFMASCRTNSPETVAATTGVEAESIRKTAHLLWHNRPLANFAWTGLEQHADATQTARAHATLHALTGRIDVPDGNVHFAQVPLNDVSGAELRKPGRWQKRWAGRSARSGLPQEVGSLRMMYTALWRTGGRIA
jgi:anaerobic selenocysteine-containing dehydrogenase